MTDTTTDKGLVERAREIVADVDKFGINAKHPTSIEVRNLLEKLALDNERLERERDEAQEQAQRFAFVAERQEEHKITQRMRAEAAEARLSHITAIRARGES